MGFKICFCLPIVFMLKGVVILIDYDSLLKKKLFCDEIFLYLKIIGLSEIVEIIYGNKFD